MGARIRTFTVDGVTTYEAEVNGETIQWDARLTYDRHLQVPELLETQRPVSDEPDEILFIIMHQSMELWMKLCLHETKIAIDRVSQDELDQAFKTFDRIATIQRHMIHSWEVLATLTPYDFLTFRGYLGKASGFQSYQYRALEFALGSKNAELLVVHENDPETHQYLLTALNTPSLYDQVLTLLARRGFAIPEEVLERDWSKPYEPHDAVEAVWHQIYDQAPEHWDLYTLGEKITALEYYFQEWRFKHMKTVSRIIGNKRGTGGTSGVNYLVKALDLSFFPELWTMRTTMVAPVAKPPSDD